MKKVGITGQSGFMGTHFYNQLGLMPDIVRIPFCDSYFEEDASMDEFVHSCDVIIHLAAMNRNQDADLLYHTNIGLVQKLIASLQRTSSKPHVIFSSSIQEELDNVYGKSKREGRLLLEQWSQQSGSFFTSMLIPNVFGPFGKPFYNSVVATFCHLLATGGEPEIHVDSEIKLIYIDDLFREFYKAISGEIQTTGYRVPFTVKLKVSEILGMLRIFKEFYQEKGIIPVLDSAFKVNLFNTFRSYIDSKTFFPVKLTQHSDTRGAFVEVVRLGVGGQVSFSTTKPGITRGNHYHTRKIERFAVIRGKAVIQLRRIGESRILEFLLDGESPSFVDMPVWHTHNITNVGKDDLYTIFWINEWYDPDDPDTYFEKV